MSPWPAPAIFGKENFGDGALSILKEIIDICSSRNKTYYIGGYSLAGLFSLWTTYQTNIFSGVASCSPSIWFPNFIEYMENNKIFVNKVYLSLGDKEDKTRNNIVSTVSNKIKEAYQHLNSENIKTVLEWNKGNHFQDSDIRIAKGFVWLLNN